MVRMTIQISEDYNKNHIHKFQNNLCYNNHKIHTTLRRIHQPRILMNHNQLESISQVVSSLSHPSLPLALLRRRHSSIFKPKSRFVKPLSPTQPQPCICMCGGGRVRREEIKWEKSRRGRRSGAGTEPTPYDRNGLC